MKVSADRVASRYAMVSNPLLDGMDKHEVVELVKKLTKSAKLNGVFHDTHWEPVNRLRRIFHADKLQHEMMAGYIPIRNKIGQTTGMEWKLSIAWRDGGGIPQDLWLIIVASGLGPADDVMKMYDISYDLKFPW